MGFRESVVSEVFGGEVRCVLQRQGAKESATVEPFFSLQLDIQVSLSSLASLTFYKPRIFCVKLYTFCYVLSPCIVHLSSLSLLSLVR